MSKYTQSLFLLLSFCLLAGTACHKKPPSESPSHAPAPMGDEKIQAPPAKSSKSAWETPASAPAKPLHEEEVADREEAKFQTVYFVFDSAALSAEARDALGKNAEWLHAHPSIHITIEGHCDERGTIEYNMALGEHRAEAAKRYLGSLGVDAKRLFTLSYGKERPIDSAHNEAAWAKNRRCEFVVE